MIKSNKVAGVYVMSISKGDIDYFYIGSSEDLIARFSDHRRKLKDNRHHCKTIQAIYNEGLAVRFEVLETAETYKKLISTENEYIEHFKRIDGIIVANVRKPVENSPRVYLNESKVKKIKTLIAAGITSKDIAIITDTKIRQVYRIKCGERWHNV